MLSSTQNRQLNERSNRERALLCLGTWVDELEAVHMQVLHASKQEMTRLDHAVALHDLQPGK